MPDSCSDYNTPMKVCLCRADNCFNVTFKQTRTKDVLLIFLDLLLETYQNGIDELINYMKADNSLQEREKIELIKKKYPGVFDKYFASYDLFKKMKSSKNVKVENEYRRHVTITFDSGLTLDIDKCGQYLAEAREFAQLVLKTIGNIKE